MGSCVASVASAAFLSPIGLPGVLRIIIEEKDERLHAFLLLPSQADPCEGQYK